ncbi:hypothetical protein PT7_2331 [Pusillimonas sp. T7-7]|uniref:DUF3540 domain-containing protein n=1 Tax=Pusillimonas sp. (strain T7-7) TaxID=1007105 RepID=UPI0002084357|nr:DUF3540 domain-containing protein [Pusillimonas sp. T7-7]AEC20871.1 hypothetical protein PT7_2331 [Pusillimonas sp. T7-7]
MNTLRAEKTSLEAAANTDPRPAHGQARQYHARLLMQEGRRYCALTDEGAIWTMAAAGCLLQPAVGDIALVSIMNGTGYVLTVLERADDSQVAVLAMDGDTRLQVQDGKLEIACQDMDVRGDRLTACWNQRTDIAIEHLEYAARSEAYLGRSTRRISGHEETSANSSRSVVQKDWTTLAGVATVVGKDRTVVDGDSVQIG